MNANAKAYSRSTRRPRRETRTCALSGAVLLLTLPASVLGQPTPYPILTYPGAPTAIQCPGPNCYQVNGSGGISTNALQYSRSSGSPAWSDLTTVVWRNVNATFTGIPTYGLNPPGAYPTLQRWSYDFYLDATRCPTWDQPCGDPNGVHKPRIEFDSSVSDVGNGCDPSLVPWTWESQGVITPTTPEKIFTWSMYLTTDPACCGASSPHHENGRYWATLNQLHTGGPWNTLDCSDCCNWYTVPPCLGVDCNPWPVVASNNVVFDPLQFPLPLFFHTNRRNETVCCDQSLCGGNTEPPRMWTMNLPNAYGQWVDFAMYIKPSTIFPAACQPDNADGRIRFWVGGTEVTNSPWDGRDFYFRNPNWPPPGPYLPFYYVKQGYYRAPQLDGGVFPAPDGVHVYMTPLMVTSPSSPAYRTR
jgi:hypothetical protein